MFSNCFDVFQNNFMFDVPDDKIASNFSEYYFLEFLIRDTILFRIVLYFSKKKTLDVFLNFLYARFLFLISLFI